MSISITVLSGCDGLPGAAGADEREHRVWAVAAEQQQDSTRSCASSALVLLAGSSWPRLSAAS